MLMQKAARKPMRYSPSAIVKMKIVIVPGQGTRLAPKTTPTSVLLPSVEQALQLQVGGCAENDVKFLVFLLLKNNIW